jgi:hypothetical protein
VDGNRTQFQGGSRWKSSLSETFFPSGEKGDWLQRPAIPEVHFPSKVAHRQVEQDQPGSSNSWSGAFVAEKANCLLFWAARDRKGKEPSSHPRNWAWLGLNLETHGWFESWS